MLPPVSREHFSHLLRHFKFNCCDDLQKVIHLSEGDSTGDGYYVKQSTWNRKKTCKTAICNGTSSSKPAAFLGIYSWFSLMQVVRNWGMVQPLIRIGIWGTWINSHIKHGVSRIPGTDIIQSYCFLADFKFTQLADGTGSWTMIPETVKRGPAIWFKGELEKQLPGSIHRLHLHKSLVFSRSLR